MSKFELNSGDVVSMELKQSIAGLQTFISGLTQVRYM